MSCGNPENPVQGRRRSDAAHRLQLAIDIALALEHLGLDVQVTLDTYADLFDDDLDAVAMTLDSRYSPESVAKMWPQGRNDVL